MSVVITEEFNVIFNSDKSTGTTEYLTLQTNKAMSS
jgi:hypothetical protein